jgi:hypothetical protein
MKEAVPFDRVRPTHLGQLPGASCEGVGRKCCNGRVRPTHLGQLPGASCEGVGRKCCRRSGSWSGSCEGGRGSRHWWCSCVGVGGGGCGRTGEGVPVAGCTVLDVLKVRTKNTVPSWRSNLELPRRPPGTSCGGGPEGWSSSSLLWWGVGAGAGPNLASSTAAWKWIRVLAVLCCFAPPPFDSGGAATLRSCFNARHPFGNGGAATLRLTSWCGCCALSLSAVSRASRKAVSVGHSPPQVPGIKTAGGKRAMKAAGFATPHFSTMG